MTSRIIGYDVNHIGSNGEYFLLELMFKDGRWIGGVVSRSFLYELRATINGELEFHPMHLEDEPLKYSHAWEE